MREVRWLVTAAGVLLALAGGCRGTGREPVHHRVSIEALAFVPAALAVEPGDTVTWTNRDLVPHTATSTGGGWDTGQLNPSQDYQLVITEAVAGDYRCIYHPGMQAELMISP